MRESHMEHFEKECFETEYGVSGMVREKKIPMNQFYQRNSCWGSALYTGSDSDNYCRIHGSVRLLLWSFRWITAIHTCNRSESVGSCWDGKKQLRYPSSGRRIYKRRKLFKKKTDTFSGVYWCLTTAIYLA